jgi:hypothetical protein
MNEAVAIVDLDPRLVPVAIRHARLGLGWKVLQVLENWTTPAYYAVVGTAGETKRFRVRVRGPLPSQPSEDGEFVMVVRRYGDRPGWWIAPEPASLTTTLRARGSTHIPTTAARLFRGAGRPLSVCRRSDGAC